MRRIAARASRNLAIISICVIALVQLAHQPSSLMQETASPGAVFTVTNSSDSGAGSFRQAITDANAAAGTDTIQFQIGTGPVDISLASALPDITQPVIIDGATQPGYSGTPIINLFGNFGSNGLRITGGGSTVRALAITFSLNAIVLETAGDNIITGCFIGICPQSPTQICGNGINGVLVNNSSNNRIGGSTAAERNIIVSSTSDGIEITGAASSGNLILGNYIGLRADGTVARNNDSGISINGASNNRVGGTIAGERNVISGNGQGIDLPANQFKSGVLISGATASGNTVQGNYIGTTIDGSAAVPGGSRLNGVRIDNAPNNTIGGTFGTTPGGSCTGACNVISGIVLRGGIVITGSGATGNSVLGNFIGTNAAGTSNVGNNVGVTITDTASNNTVGGTTAAGRNLINNGMIITAGAATNTVQGNYIGTDTTGNIARGTGTQFPSLLVAVGIDSSPNNRIGTAAATTLGGACTGGCNLISGNSAAHGVFITGAGSTGNRVDYNYIGLNAAGTTALRNGGDAITLRNGANGNIIGRPLTLTPLQEASLVEMIPSEIFRIQDDVTGDYVELDTLNRRATFRRCKSPADIVEDGEVTTTGPYLYFRGPRIGVSISTITRNASANIRSLDTFEPITDSNIDNSTALCPTGCQQTILGTVTNGINNDPNPPNNNIFNFLSVGSSANGLVTLSTPTADGYFRHLAGSFTTYSNSFVNTNGDNFGPISMAAGTDNFVSGLRWNGISPGTMVNWPLDLNDNQSRDPNDPLDVDGGANRTQNFPVITGIRRLLGGNASITFAFNSTPNTRYKLEFHRRISRISDGILIFYRRHPVADVEVMTGADGNSTTTKIVVEGPAAEVALFGDGQVDATATVVNQVLSNSEDGIDSIVDVLGDTSELSPPVVVPQPTFDFDNDGKTDITVYRPGATQNDLSDWYILNSSDSSVRIVQFGIGEDKIVPGDYQGDGVTDFAVFRPSTSTWYFSRITGNPATNFTGIQWGAATDTVVPGDYDGDGANDLAIFRPSDGSWWIRLSIDGSHFVQRWGLSTDKPVPTDYDGDGDTDIAVYRNGTWYISPCQTCPTQYAQFGLSSDIPVPADYDGDGRADVAVWRPSEGNWYLNQSTAGFSVRRWGISGDKLLNGDFDADGKSDVAVWRPSEGIFYLQRSEAGFSAIRWGVSTDVPVGMFPNQ